MSVAARPDPAYAPESVTIALLSAPVVGFKKTTVSLIDITFCKPAVPATNNVIVLVVPAALATESR
jgi:hypothetical protein